MSLLSAVDILCICSLFFIVSQNWSQIAKTIGNDTRVRGCSIQNLPLDCIQRILGLLTQEDVLSFSLVSKQLCAYAKCHLFQNIYVTLHLPIRPKIFGANKWTNTCDISSSWTFIKPPNFWKMIHLYHFDNTLIRKLVIGDLTFSNEFIQDVIFRRISSSTKIYLEGAQSLISNRLHSTSVREGELQSINHFERLRKLQVFSDSDGQFHDQPDLPFLEELILVGDPLRTQKQFTKIQSVVKISLVFNLPPHKTTITTNLDIPTAKTQEFQISFTSTFYSKERPQYVEEIDDFFQALALPKLKKLSIMSQDNRNKQFKYVMPNYNKFISSLPRLDVIHLSIGSEFDLARFPSLSRHSSTLRRLAWIGNINASCYPHYDAVKNLKFDMVNGVFLTSPMEIRARRSASNNDIEEMFSSSMLTLAQARGKNYFELDDYNYCKFSVGDVGNAFIADIAWSCKGNLVPEFSALEYLIINGLHFKITNTFDGRKDMTCIYN